MKRKPLLYGLFYACGITAVVFLKTHPEMHLAWLTALLYFALSWPLVVFYNSGKFQFAIPLPEKKGERSIVLPEVSSPPKKKTISSIELIRQAEREHEDQRKQRKESPKVPNPPDKRKTSFSPKKSADKKEAANALRTSESKHIVPPAPVVSESTISSEAHDYWESKQRRRTRHPGEVSLPLFPEDEATINANVDSQDPFL